MIFVILGTQDKSFVRLLESIELNVKNGVIKDKVIVQAGFTKFSSDKIKIFDFVPKEKLAEFEDEADLIITHAGVGSIVSALKKGKKVIVVPRLKKYGEHTNDHQIQIIKEFSKKGYILPVNDLNELEKVLKKIENFQTKPYQSNTNNMVKLVEEQIEKLY